MKKHTKISLIAAIIIFIVIYFSFVISSIDIVEPKYLLIEPIVMTAFVFGFGFGFSNFTAAILAILTLLTPSIITFFVIKFIVKRLNK